MLYSCCNTIGYSGVFLKELKLGRYSMPRAYVLCSRNFLPQLHIKYLLFLFKTNYQVSVSRMT